MCRQLVCCVQKMDGSAGRIKGFIFILGCVMMLEATGAVATSTMVLVIFPKRKDPMQMHS